MNASKVKPSQAHGNEEVLRAKAAEANRKRNQRKREAAWQEAEERARQEPKAEEPKAEEPKTRKFGKVIKVRANGIEYATLTEFVITLPNCGKVDGKHSTYAISQWNKLNGQLKKKGWVEVNGIIIEAI